MLVKVKGIGQTRCGELWNDSLADLMGQAIRAALADAKMSGEEIGQIFVGNMLGGGISGQSHLGSLAAEILEKNVPAVRVEAACASGGMAVYQALESLEAGNCDNVLVVGVEKMTDAGSEEIATLLMQAASAEERLSGATFPALYALMAEAYLQKFPKAPNTLSLPSILAHRSAVKNELAHFRKEINIQDVHSSPIIAPPLRMLDCAPISDGAAALVFSREQPQKNKREAFIIAKSCATDTLSLSGRKKITELASTQIATKMLLKNSGLALRDIDLAEIHDCFSIAALLAVEDIGFAPRGQGGAFFEKLLHEGGHPVINPSGGLKACGHPVGATGVKQIAEVALHLRGQAGTRQVPKARYGLTHNVGGTGATCVMNLLASSEAIS